MHHSGEPPSTGKWLEECKHVIESSGGSVNKFLGDGFFAAVLASCT